MSGLFLVTTASGLIKPCKSALGGDQFHSYQVSKLIYKILQQICLNIYSVQYLPVSLPFHRILGYYIDVQIWIASVFVPYK